MTISYASNMSELIVVFSACAGHNKARRGIHDRSNISMLVHGTRTLTPRCHQTIAFKYTRQNGAQDWFRDNSYNPTYVYVYSYILFAWKSSLFTNCHVSCKTCSYLKVACSMYVCIDGVSLIGLCIAIGLLLPQ
jgi:hypothetical protein